MGVNDEHGYYPVRKPFIKHLYFLYFVSLQVYYILHYYQLFDRCKPAHLLHPAQIIVFLKKCSLHFYYILHFYQIDQSTWLSPCRPGFNSRCSIFSFFQLSPFFTPFQRFLRGKKGGHIPPYTNGTKCNQLESYCTFTKINALSAPLCTFEKFPFKVSFYYIDRVKNAKIRDMMDNF